MNLINISFYLLTPKADKTQVYVSLYRDGQRLRFAAGFQFHTEYCNEREVKGKRLVRKNTEFYLDYKAKLDAAATQFHRLEMRMPDASLAQIRHAYELATGKTKPEPEAKLTFDGAWKTFVSESSINWTVGYTTVMEGLRRRLKDFEAWKGTPVDVKGLDKAVWLSLMRFLSEQKRLSNNTTNVNLKGFRRFWTFCQSKGYCPAVSFKGMDYFEEIETFKISIKEHELVTLADIDLSAIDRLERVRDLFLLEILTGQRYSDVHKVLDTANHDETSINIYQKKGRKFIRIPTHPKLIVHLDLITRRYPDGLPKISNQKFNAYLKEVGKLCGFNKVHQWPMLRGTVMETESDHRYNLITSHTGRRTFCTLAIGRGIDTKSTMAVSGHTKYDQFMEYVRVDDEDIMKQFTDKF